MARIVAVVLLLLFAALWIASGLHSQQSMSGVRATVQKQLTVVSKPSATNNR